MRENAGSEAVRSLRTVAEKVHVRLAAKLVIESALTGAHADDPALLYGLARAQLGHGDGAGAEASFDTLRKVSPKAMTADAYLAYARALEIQGKDADQWNVVRDHLPLLTEVDWYSRVKNGYARGWEPVRFVDNIRSYLDVLSWVAADTGRPAEREPLTANTAEAAPPRE